MVNSTRPGSPLVDPDEVTRVFTSMGARAVHPIPFDIHLAEGGEIDMSLLGKDTRRAFLELAAVVADEFARTMQTP